MLPITRRVIIAIMVLFVLSPAAVPAGNRTCHNLMFTSLSSYLGGVIGGITGGCVGMFIDSGLASIGYQGEYSFHPVTTPYLTVAGILAGAALGGLTGSTGWALDSTCRNEESSTDRQKGRDIEDLAGELNTSDRQLPETTI